MFTKNYLILSKVLYIIKHVAKVYIVFHFVFVYTIDCIRELDQVRVMSPVENRLLLAPMKLSRFSRHFFHDIYM